jgi:hypothetical protein
MDQTNTIMIYANILELHPLGQNSVQVTDFCTKYLLRMMKTQFKHLWIPRFTRCKRDSVTGYTKQ